MMPSRNSQAKRTGSNRLVQAYRQAPWRLQTQRGVTLLVVAILGTAVLWVMLSVDVKAQEAFLDFRDLQKVQEKLQREIAATHTDIAIQTSASHMKSRAEELGFQPVDPADIEYVIVHGYAGREPQIQAPLPSAAITQPLVKPAFRQSLWEWLLQGILAISEPAALPAGGTPP